MDQDETYDADEDGMCCVIKKWTGPSLDSAVGQFGFKSGLGHYVVLSKVKPLFKCQGT